MSDDCKDDNNNSSSSSSTKEDIPIISRMTNHDNDDDNDDDDAVVVDNEKDDDSKMESNANGISKNNEQQQVEQEVVVDVTEESTMDEITTTVNTTTTSSIVESIDADNSNTNDNHNDNNVCSSEEKLPVEDTPPKSVEASSVAGSATDTIYSEEEEDDTCCKSNNSPQNEMIQPTMVILPTKDDDDDDGSLVMKTIQAKWESMFAPSNDTTTTTTTTKLTSHEMLHQILNKYSSQMERYTLMEDDMANLQANIVSSAERESLLEQEVNTLRNIREENETKCNFLQNKLVEAQKSKASLENLKPLQAQIQQVTSDKNKLEASMDKLKKKCVERVKLAESALQEERKLNEDRKEKMREYVHQKSEELRASADANSGLQLELRETNDTLRQVKHKLDILTEQYTTSQVRNRELTRELQHMEKNKQQWMEMGETMEAELQKTTLQTEEHKNKRLTAKNELMSVLKKLEAEQAITAQLRDAIKFTFTPKALSQQQLLQEGLGELETEIVRLSKRLGKPTIMNGSNQTTDDTNDTTTTATNGTTPLKGSRRKSRMEVDVSRLLATLENETQKVSKGIMAFSVCVEQMHRMLDDSGDRTCVDLFTQLLLNTDQHRPLTQVPNEDDNNFEEGNFVQHKV